MAQNQVLSIDDEPATKKPPSQVVPVESRPVISNVQESETVQGQLRGLLDKGNPLMRQSRDRAIQYAAGRGLQNSTLAAQAGEQAYISQALPIAQQDAATYSDRSVVNVTERNKFGLQEQGGNIQSRLQREQGDINSRLQREQFNFELQLSDRNFQHQQKLMVEEYAQRRGLSAQESNQEIARLNRLHEQTLEQIRVKAGVDAGARDEEFTRALGASYLQSISQRQAATSAEIQSIYQTQGLSSAQQRAAVNSAYARFQSDVQLTALYYQQAPQWDDSWGVMNPQASATPTVRPGGPSGPINPTIPSVPSTVPSMRTGTQGLAGFNYQER